MIRYMAVLAALTIASGPQMCVAQQAKAAADDCAAVTTAPANHSTMDHASHLASLDRCAPGLIPTSPGQAAYGAISEIVRILKADPKTDWTKVNIEAVRQHLIDMNEVTMQSTAAQRNIAGGIEVDVTGTSRAINAIRRMTKNHTSMLEQGADYHASAEEIPGGARLTVTAKDAGDANIVARIRALGFAGIMTEGDHHTAHHLALARGQSVHGR